MGRTLMVSSRAPGTNAKTLQLRDGVQRLAEESKRGLYLSLTSGGPFMLLHFLRSFIFLLSR